MNELELLKQLGLRSEAEATPGIDVVDRVIRQIAHKPAGMADRTGMVDPRLSLVSICACALSALALAVTWSAKPNSDGLASLSEAAATQTGPEALLRVLEP